jgi:putative NADH-flavin reductase
LSASRRRPIRPGDFDLGDEQVKASFAERDGESRSMATVLIMGASRGIGLEALKQALAAGHIVRALARTARGIPVEHSHLQKIDGDALDSVAVQRALADVDVVIQSLGLSAGPELIFRPVRLFSEATLFLVAAMKEAGTKRLICVTGFGAGDSRGRGGLLYNTAICLLLGRAYEDKDVQEQIIRRSRLQWIIVRPVILTNGPKTGAYRALIDPRDWRCGFISRADVADFLVKQIDDDRFLRATPVLSA